MKYLTFLILLIGCGNPPPEVVGPKVEYVTCITSVEKSFYFDSSDDSDEFLCHFVIRRDLDHCVRLSEEALKEAGKRFCENGGGECYHIDVHQNSICKNKKTFLGICRLDLSRGPQ